jgi:hypothetical protein
MSKLELIRLTSTTQYCATQSVLSRILQRASEKAPVPTIGSTHHCSAHGPSLARSRAGLPRHEHLHDQSKQEQIDERTEWQKSAHRLPSRCHHEHHGHRVYRTDLATKGPMYSVRFCSTWLLTPISKTAFSAAVWGSASVILLDWMDEVKYWTLSEEEI